MLGCLVRVRGLVLDCGRPLVRPSKLLLVAVTVLLLQSGRPSQAKAGPGVSSWSAGVSTFGNGAPGPSDQRRTEYRDRKSTSMNDVKTLKDQLSSTQIKDKKKFIKKTEDEIYSNVNKKRMFGLSKNANPTKKLTKLFKGDDGAINVRKQVIGRNTRSTEEKKPNLARILNGRKIGAEARPWTVMIVETNRIIGGEQDLYIGKDGVHNFFRCTGVLIGQRFVLTAAHCMDFNILNPLAGPNKRKLYRMTQAELFVGQSTLSSNPKPSGMEIILDDKNVFYHKDYIKKDGHNPYFSIFADVNETEPGGPDKYINFQFSKCRPDLAIIKLDRSVRDVPGMKMAKIIKLPKGPELDKDYFKEKKCKLTGAGQTENGTIGILTDTDITLTDLNGTRKWNDRLYAYMDHSKSEAAIKAMRLKCAAQEYLNIAKEKSDPDAGWYGDSGAPLACQGEGEQIVLAAIVKDIWLNRTEEGEMRQRGSTFTRVAPYVDWINEVMDREGRESERRESGAAPKPRAAHAPALAAAAALAVRAWLT